MRGFRSYYGKILAAIRLLLGCCKIGKQVNGVRPQRKACIAALLSALRGGRAVFGTLGFSWGLPHRLRGFWSGCSQSGFVVGEKTSHNFREQKVVEKEQCSLVAAQGKG